MIYNPIQLQTHIELSKERLLSFNKWLMLKDQTKKPLNDKTSNLLLAPIAMKNQYQRLG